MSKTGRRECNWCGKVTNRRCPTHDGRSGEITSHEGRAKRAAMRIWSLVYGHHSGLATGGTAEASITDLVLFAKAKAAEARAAAASRESMGTAFHEGTEADWETGRQLAEQQTGRPMPKQSASEREQERLRHQRIAAKYVEEAEVFDAIVAALLKHDDEPESGR